MKRITKLVPALAALALVGSIGLQSAQAIPVTYTTSGQFVAGPNATVVGSNLIFTRNVTGGTQTLTITYEPQALTTLNPPPPTGGGLGSFVVSLTGTASNDVFVLPSGSVFNLTVNQLQPSAGTGTLQGQITGQVALGSGTAGPSGTVGVVFANQMMNIGLATYQLINLTGGNTVILGFGGDSRTSVEALVNAIPEPSSIAMAGVGLVGLVGLGLRRRRRTV